MTMTDEQPALKDILKDRQFCLLTTFKKNGDGVATPMWFALDGEHAVMTTRGNSWKVRRLKRNPKVTIGWSDHYGMKHGELYDAVARLVKDEDEFQNALGLLNKKYGLKKKLIDFGLTFAKDKTEAIIKVSLASVEQG